MKLEPLTFGSIITLSLDEFPNYYLYSEGFLTHNIKLKKFDPTELVGKKDHDYSLCTFKILPFSTSSKL